ncbi:MAG: haloacid dehalogenase [Myxococcales bacterium]
MDWSHIEALTFDCYGTLIDWETGILEAVRPVIARYGTVPDDDALIALYADCESAAERPPYKPYRTVLRWTMERMAHGLGFELEEEDRDALVESLGRWPAWPDTAEALRALGGRWRLAVLSNVDRDLFELTRPLLGVGLDAVVTAEDVGGYKPGRGHFDRGLEVLALPPDRVLHVAQSVWHDVAPASALGFRTVHVVRRRSGRGFGASLPASAAADVVVPDLATLARLAGCAG